MADNWDKIDHWHKYLITMPEDRSQFKGSVLAINVNIDDLPSRILCATEYAIANIRKLIDAVE